jgi:signal transduction histidine kinase
MTAPRILIVEDERIIALNMRHQLTKLGYDVPNAVSTGDHALRRIEEAVPDLVLMDINLKGELDGIATATAIRQTSVIPIIYITAYSADETLARAAATNPHGYLLKPFSERELHAMIQVTLARCRTERASLAARERRQQAAKMEALSRLAGGVADEVDDLLSSLYGQLEVLGGYVIDEPALNEPFQDAFSDAIDKERLVRQLLEFCGRRKLTPATVSLNDLLTQLGGRLRQIVGDTIAIQVLLPDDLWQTWVDPDRLTQALANLATNARAAMPNQGSLTIEAQNIIIARNPLDDGTHIGDYVLLSVSDTGCGMAEAVVERAFEPFFTTRPSGTVSGLGLSLVFSFVRQSGGDITIDSKPGKGSTVRLYLPAAASSTGVIAAPSETEPRWGGRLGPTGQPTTRTGRQSVLSHPTATANQPTGDAVRRLPITSRKRHVASPVMWHRTENGMFASMSGAGFRGHYHLVVEPMPREPGWDWTVWRRGSKGKHARHGRASSVVSAMAAAENAAEVWSRGGQADDRSDPTE